MKLSIENVNAEIADALTQFREDKNYQLFRERNKWARGAIRSCTVRVNIAKECAAQGEKFRKEIQKLGL